MKGERRQMQGLSQTRIGFLGRHGAGALALCCSLLGLGLLSALHLICYCLVPVHWDGHGSYLYKCVAFEWQSCRDLLLACYGLAGIGLGVGLATSARRTRPGVMSIVLALGVLAMEAALHTLPTPPVYTASGRPEVARIDRYGRRLEYRTYPVLSGGRMTGTHRT